VAARRIGALLCAFGTTARSTLGQQSNVTTKHRNENELAEFGFPQESVIAMGWVVHLLADLMI